MGWFDRFRRKRGTSKDATPEAPAQPRAQWLAADANPFGIPVLDLISITGQMQSMSGDPAAALRAISWSARDVADLEAPSEAIEVACPLLFPVAAQFPDGLLFTPLAMEDKWVIAHRDAALWLARSWTGRVIARLPYERVADTIRVRTGWMRADDGLDGFGPVAQIVDWMIRTHALDQRLPLPVHADGAALLESTPLAAMNVFGHRAICAARGWSPPPPPRPLRSEGLLLSATRVADLDALRAAIQAGEPLDAPSGAGGYTALMCAVINDARLVAQCLLDAGADPNVRGDRGESALLFAVVHGASVALLEVLLAAGARLDHANDDGFGALHAAAETDRPTHIAPLVQAGADLDARTGRGLAPVHIAAGLGNVAALDALVAAGADPRADSPMGTPEAIGRAEGKAEIVAWFRR